MFRKMVLGTLVLALLGGIALWSRIGDPWSVIKGRLSGNRAKEPQTAPQAGEPESMDVETLLASAEDEYFDKAGVQRFREKIEAPDFTLKNLEGQEVSLKDLRGKLVFLNFWATWCGPCRIEKPTLEKLYQEFKDKGLVILAVSIDQGDSIQLVRSYMEEHKLSYGSLLDPENAVGKMYAVRGIPVTYLIDGEGTIIGAAMGARLWDKKEARKLVAYLLEKPKK